MSRGMRCASAPTRARPTRCWRSVGAPALVDRHCATLAYADAKRVELAIALAGRPRAAADGRADGGAGDSPSAQRMMDAVRAQVARRRRRRALHRARHGHRVRLRRSRDRARPRTRHRDGAAGRRCAPTPRVQARLPGRRLVRFRSRANPGLSQLCERLLEVGDQVARILEPDRQAQHRPRGVERASACARARGVPGSRGSRSRPSYTPARTAGGASSSASTRAFATGFSTTPNSPTRAGEVALPQRVAARAWQRRIEHLRDVVARSEPRRDRHRALLMARETHRQRAQTAQREKAVVARRGDAEVRPLPHASARAWPRCTSRRRAAGRSGRRCTWSPRAPTRRRRGRTRESRAVSPTCCRRRPTRRAHARPARSPECPARRTSAIPATRRTRRASSAASMRAMPAPISGS